LPNTEATPRPVITIRFFGGAAEADTLSAARRLRRRRAPGQGACRLRDFMANEERRRLEDSREGFTCAIRECDM
jgi:hypothetical protein